ncbi:MAG TPA: bifunctional nuclease family protein [Longimicrobiaceae bacterium]|nr:bifunctional nuclease family protein [Longimicrobiaceae bacterium]
MIEIKVQSLGLDQVSKSPVVILQEIEGTRVLPIWIGPAEASAIAMELAGMTFARPLTHDLAASMLRGMGGELKRVLITRVQDNTYFAEMVIERGEEMFSLDARPSDAIAIALRTESRLFTTDGLLAAGGVEIEDASAEDAGVGSEGAQGMTAEELQEYLKKMNPEDLGRFNP